MLNSVVSGSLTVSHSSHQHLPPAEVSLHPLSLDLLLPLRPWHHLVLSVSLALTPSTLGTAVQLLHLSFWDWGSHQGSRPLEVEQCSLCVTTLYSCPCPWPDHFLEWEVAPTSTSPTLLPCPTLPFPTLGESKKIHKYTLGKIIKE